MLPKGAFYPSELEAAMNAVRERFNEQEKRIVNLEQQVANQAVGLKNLGSLNVALQRDVALKSQAAQRQAQGSNYMQEQQQQAQGSNYMQEQLDAKPLRSDTKPLLEMAAFVRKIADISLPEADRILIDFIIEAREILRRST